MRIKLNAKLQWTRAFELRLETRSKALEKEWKMGSAAGVEQVKGLRTLSRLARNHRLNAQWWLGDGLLRERLHWLRVAHEITARDVRAGCRRQRVGREALRVRSRVHRRRGLRELRTVALRPTKDALRMNTKEAPKKGYSLLRSARTTSGKCAPAAICSAPTPPAARFADVFAREFAEPEPVPTPRE